MVLAFASGYLTKSWYFVKTNNKRAGRSFFDVCSMKPRAVPSLLSNPDRHQLKLLRIVLAVLFVFSVLIGSLNVLLFNAYQVAAFNFISALAGAAIFGYLHHSRNLTIASWLVIAAILFNLTAFMLAAKGAAYSIIWLTVLPPLAFFLLGRRAGSWVTAGVFLTTLALLVFFQSQLPTLKFSTGAILNIAEVFIILWLLFRFYEGSRQAALQELKRLSVIDKLTGLHNRAKLDDLLETHIHLAARSSLPLVVMLIDIDHFKQVNDQHGHLRGDEILQQVATALTSRIRATDQLGRWGGEEFLLLCPDTALQDGIQLADSLRLFISESIAIQGKPLTLSFGVTVVRQHSSANEVIRQADAALYAAKGAGRNSVSYYQAVS